MSYGLFVTFRALPGRGDALAQLLRDALESLGEVPCLDLCLVHRSPDDPDLVRVVEEWTSRAEHEAVAALPEVRELIARVHALCEGAPEIVSTVPVACLTPRSALAD